MKKKGQTKKPEENRQKGSIKKQVLISVVIFLVLSTITALVVAYGKGYSLGITNGRVKIAKTGILNAASTPRGAEVYINGHLTTATNNSVNLTPGKYAVTISKDGYYPWKKDIEIKQEEVANTDALLFPVAPTLQSLSTFGVQSPIIDPFGTRIAFRIKDQSNKKNGIYILDMNARSFPVLVGQSNSTQVVDDTTDAFSTGTISWSPDGQQLLASVSSALATPTYYLLKINGFNDTPQDITATLPAIQEAWSAQKIAKEQSRLQALKPQVRNLIKRYFKVISWSPDETKILYQASESGDLPTVIKPRRIGNNLLYERRDLKKDAIYVYNITEDVNTRVIDTINPVCNYQDIHCTEKPFTWYSDSEHLVYVHNKKIDIIEDDGANTRTLYAGPFVDHFVYAWPDGSRLVILTNLNNQDIPPTLYTISLK